MIARHSLEQSGDGEGVEVVENTECFDPKHGKGQFTEKRIHLSRYISICVIMLLAASCQFVFHICAFIFCVY